jgi:5-methylcytosine-specific restriction enzyme subunit McrC
MPASVTAFEHDLISVQASPSARTITPEEADRLSLIGESRPGFLQRRYESLKVAQYCGVVTMGARALEVLPKIDERSSAEDCRGLLLRLLRQSERFAVFRHVDVGQHLRSSNLLEAFIAAFFDAVTLVVRGGLLQVYSEREEDLRLVRGRIQSSRQFAALANRPDLLACRFDVLTADNQWNRPAKFALRVVRRWIQNLDLHRRWAELLAVFDDVLDVPMGVSDLDKLVFDRKARRYEEVLEWVRWILQTLSPSLRSGSAEAPGLLFDMNLVFQSAVSGAMQRGAPPSLRVSAQDTGTYLARLGGKAAFGLRPDLVVRQGDKVVAVGDIKWKILQPSHGRLIPSEADMYQMNAYAAAYRCENLCLIYPWHAAMGTSSGQPAFSLPAFGEIAPRVSIVCVDVHATQIRAVLGQETVMGQLLRG